MLAGRPVTRLLVVTDWHQQFVSTGPTWPTFMPIRGTSPAFSSGSIAPIAQTNTAPSDGPHSGDPSDKGKRPASGPGMTSARTDATPLEWLPQDQDNPSAYYVICALGGRLNKLGTPLELKNAQYFKPLTYFDDHGRGRQIPPQDLLLVLDSHLNKQLYVDRQGKSLGMEDMGWRYFKQEIWNMRPELGRSTAKAIAQVLASIGSSSGTWR